MQQRNESLNPRDAMASIFSSSSALLLQTCKTRKEKALMMKETQLDLVETVTGNGFKFKFSLLEAGVFLNNDKPLSLCLEEGITISSGIVEAYLLAVLMMPEKNKFSFEKFEEYLSKVSQESEKYLTSRLVCLCEVLAKYETENCKENAEDLRVELLYQLIKFLQSHGWVFLTKNPVTERAMESGLLRLSFSLSMKHCLHFLKEELVRGDRSLISQQQNEQRKNLLLASICEHPKLVLSKEGEVKTGGSNEILDAFCEIATLLIQNGCDPYQEGSLFLLSAPRVMSVQAAMVVVSSSVHAAFMLSPERGEEWNKIHRQWCAVTDLTVVLRRVVENDDDALYLENIENEIIAEIDRIKSKIEIRKDNVAPLTYLVDIICRLKPVLNKNLNQKLAQIVFEVVSCFSKSDAEVNLALDIINMLDTYEVNKANKIFFDYYPEEELLIALKNFLVSCVHRHEKELIEAFYKIFSVESSFEYYHESEQIQRSKLHEGIPSMIDFDRVKAYLVLFRVANVKPDLNKPIIVIYEFEDGEIRRTKGTMLHLAAYYADELFCQLLLEMGANIEIPLDKKIVSLFSEYKNIYDIIFYNILRAVVGEDESMGKSLLSLVEMMISNNYIQEEDILKIFSSRNGLRAIKKIYELLEAAILGEKSVGAMPTKPIYLVSFFCEFSKYIKRCQPEYKKLISELLFFLLKKGVFSSDDPQFIIALARLNFRILSSGVEIFLEKNERNHSFIYELLDYYRKNKGKTLSVYISNVLKFCLELKNRLDDTFVSFLSEEHEGVGVFDLLMEGDFETELLYFAEEMSRHPSKGASFLNMLLRVNPKKQRSPAEYLVQSVTGNDVGEIEDMQRIYHLLDECLKKELNLIQVMCDTYEFKGRLAFERMLQKLSSIIELLPSRMINSLWSFDFARMMSSLMVYPTVKTVDTQHHSKTKKVRDRKLGEELISSLLDFLNRYNQGEMYSARLHTLTRLAHGSDSVEHVDLSHPEAVLDSVISVADLSVVSANQSFSSSADSTSIVLASLRSPVVSSERGELAPTSSDKVRVPVKVRPEELYDWCKSGNTKKIIPLLTNHQDLWNCMNSQYEGKPSALRLLLACRDVQTEGLNSLVIKKLFSYFDLVKVTDRFRRKLPCAWGNKFEAQVTKLVSEAELAWNQTCANERMLLNDAEAEAQVDAEVEAFRARLEAAWQGRR